MNIEYPFYSPLYLMAKPVGAACNLKCSYCYYLEKKNLFEPDNHHLMSDDVLERFIKSYIEAQIGPAVQFTWHGGEAMLRDIEFYKKVVRIQSCYAVGRVIDNSIQTNGTLLSESWCEFLKQNNWLVGISIDGPEYVHNEYRKDAGGRGTFDKVMDSIRLLQRYDIDWNAMAVVNNINVDRPEEFYNFFKEIGCQFLQFSPIVERHTANGQLATSDCDGVTSPQSIRPEQWGEFLCRIFDIWVRNDVGRMYVQLFDATLANYLGVNPGICTMGKLCGHAGVIEHNGDVYSCDHFVFPRHRLGNIRNRTVVEMMQSEQQRKFAAMKLQGLTAKCRQCKFLSLCYGECPKNRFVKIEGESNRHNYLCEGYKKFFSHTARYFDYMAKELEAHRPPANIMKLFN